MSRQRRWDPPLPGPCPKLGPQLTILVSDDDKAGVPLPPYVKLIPNSPPQEITELYPNPAPPPLSRETMLLLVQKGLNALTVDELQVAHLWLIGESFDDVCDHLKIPDGAVRKLWKQMRLKLRLALEGGEPAVSPQSAKPAG